MTTRSKPLFSHTRESLDALAQVVTRPVVTKSQLRGTVREMVATHLPESYIRLFIRKVRLK